MYEQNCSPLPSGDCLDVFGDRLAEIEHLTHQARHAVDFSGAVQEANTATQPFFARICRRLLLPGSGLVGFEHVATLARLAEQGAGCLLCLNHQSTLDVPTLYALIEDQADLAVFHRIIWVSGRKLDEDPGVTPLLAGCFQRIVVTPKAELLALENEAERRERSRLNMRTYRVMHDLRRQGWVVALFPAGTRLRPGNDASGRAIEEIDSYLKRFDYLVLGHVDGCTLPPTRDHDLSRETPRLDRIVFTFAPVVETERWRAAAALRYPGRSQRCASAHAIMAEIAALRPENILAGTATSQA
ncbi:MAG TPA: 1-acyl-sn-glycerol-3-phosphate acyltransferase [Pirellulales bacterium]|nr:1-acyl-sn-glycerol-3-phosphate acyltransferase [Pirellulales bacterium]